MKLKTGDVVEVISGRDKGVQGKVIAVDRENGKVTVEGANRRFKHVRRSQKNPQGGRLEKEQALHVSKVMLVCPQTNKVTRVGYRTNKDGVKERFAKKSGAGLGTV